MNINDPDGASLQILEGGFAKVDSRQAHRGMYVSRDDRQYWDVRGVGNFDAADTWLLIANESHDKEVYIDRVFGYCDVAGLYQIHSPDYPTLAGTVVTPIRCHNPVMAGVADVSAYQDETGNTQARVLYEGYLAANGSFDLTFGGTIILGYQECLAIDEAHRYAHRHS